MKSQQKILLYNCSAIGRTTAFYHNTGFLSLLETFYGKKIIFPEFCKTWFIPEILVRTFHSLTSQYGIIVSHDILCFNFVLNYASCKTISWDNLSILFGRSNSSNVIFKTHYALCKRPWYRVLRGTHCYKNTDQGSQI